MEEHMIIAVCVDDKLGMLFNKRRQSKDRELRKDLLSLTDKLYVNSYTAKQFSEEEQSKLYISEDFLAEAGDNAICFVENVSLDEYDSDITQLILYRWNRIYPADVRFTVDLSDWELKEEIEFKGSSHDRITRCTYMHKN